MSKLSKIRFANPPPWGVLDAAHAHAVTKFSRAATCKNGGKVWILEIKNETISDNSERNNLNEEYFEKVEEDEEAVKAGIERYQVDKSNLDNNVTCVNI